ncbi:MAG: Acetyl-coenzyme A carboxyl transferase beta chain, partial [uncultured Phycisphaerae bacterium]
VAGPEPGNPERRDEVAQGRHRRPRQAGAGGHPRGALASVPGVRRHAVPQGRRGRAEHLPRLQPPLPRVGPNPGRPTVRPRHVRGAVHGRPARRPDRVRRQEDLRRPAAGRAAEDGQYRRGRVRQGVRQGPADHAGRHGPDVHDGVDGERGRGEDHPDDRGRGGRAAATARRLLLRRGPDAGEHAVADADGQDVGRPRPARRGRAAVHLPAGRPDDRRRHGQLRDARRLHHRRAQGADRVRRPADDLEHDQGRAARRVPAERVPEGARVPRLRRPPQGPAVRDRPAGRLHRHGRRGSRRRGEARRVV